MKVLVFGATGNVGRSLVHQLADAGTPVRVYAALRAGTASFTTDTVAEVTGRPARPLAGQIRSWLTATAGEAALG